LIVQYQCECSKLLVVHWAKVKVEVGFFVL